MSEWSTTSWYDRFRDFQSLLGFGGVILTLWWNAKLKREEHERVVGHEQKTLVAALVAELASNQDQLKRCLDSMNTPNSRSTAFLNKLARDVFDGTQQKIGLIGSDQAVRIIRRYRILSVFPVSIQEALMINARARDGLAASLNTVGDIIFIQADDYDDVREKFARAISGLEDDLAAIRASMN